MTNQPPPPQGRFTQQETVDEPGIVGARWWQQSIATPIPRRSAMNGLLVLGGVLAGMAALGTCVAVASSGSSSGGGSTDDFAFQPKSALDMQKEYGWNFGATGEPLVFDGKATTSFDKGTLATLADDMAPADVRYRPYFVPTLFQAPTALPRSKPSGDPDAPAAMPLKDALVPIFTPEMAAAYGKGASLATFMTDPKAKDLAIVVDLDGPLAVAFAAGLAGVCDPVFLFDNWPHPRGVVPSHLTLAAAAYYQPLFAKARAARSGARPVFVLDRRRLAPYADDASQFDNRYTARMPSAANLAALGTKNILLVVPHSFEKEGDDIADDFLGYAGGGIAFHLISLEAFSAVGSNVPPQFVYRSPSTSSAFWSHWAADPATLAADDVQKYTPTARKTEYSAGTAPPAGAAPSRPRPTNFGMIPVAVAVGTGVILGAKLSRSGSWNRTTSSSSGS